LLAKSTPPVAAQTSGLQLEKTLLKNSNLVRVGETLTFAITITNDWNTTVITLPLTDIYDRSVLRFVDATPAQSSHAAATGTIEWDNVLAATGPLAPGQQVVVLVRFIAEHPSPRVVNRAFTHDAYDSQGNQVGNGNAEENNEAVGGKTPLTKTLDLAAPPLAGQRITFTITVRNDGLVDVLTLPVRDTFDPTALRFVSAEPPIDGESPGVLVWSNALRPPLPTVLGPEQTVQLTVVFTALRDITQTINQAEVLGASDQYGNELAPASDDVPIRILPAATTPTPAPTRAPRPTQAPARPTETIEAPTATVENTPAATAAAPAESTAIPGDLSTATPGASATPLAGGTVPVGLPNTSGRRHNWLLPLLAFALLATGLVLGREPRSRAK
ncbi:MAG TPA: hypothetical protein VD886_25090, partial [Herpetosiphonaceae bacterium]|nr:hypothetical protein [Herpetosiphonaceae bacterium]